MSKTDELIPELQQRWSPRAFDGRGIGNDQLRLLFEAARWAPSCYNDQPWSFVISRKNGGGQYQRLLSTLIEFNQSWAATAPILLFGCARRSFERNGEPNRHAWYDLGQAMGLLLVQAASMDILLHQMAGFDAEQAAQILGVPPDVEVVTVAAVGYLGDAGRLPEGMDEKDPDTRERKSMASFVFDESWSNSLF